MWCSVSWRDGSFENCIVGADEKRNEGKRRVGVGEAHGSLQRVRKESLSFLHA
jgi:hypothetical protein